MPGLEADTGSYLISPARDELQDSIKNICTLITFAQFHMIGYFLCQIKEHIQGFKCIQFVN